MKIIHVAFVLAAVMIVSCAGIDLQNPQLVQEHTLKQFNDKTGVVTYLGPDLAPESNWDVRLLAEKKSDSEVHYRLLAKVDYYREHFYGYTAIDEYYPVMHLERSSDWNSLACRGNRLTYTESGTLELSRNDLESKIENGLDYTFECRNGSREFNVSGEYISGFLSAVDGK